MKLEQLREVWQDLCRGTGRAAADAVDRAARAGRSARESAAKAGQSARTGVARAGQSARENAVKAGQSARTGAAKAGQTARAGAAKAGQAAENVVAYTRLKRKIADLRGERNAQLRTVGELVYATHRGNPTDSDCLQQALGAVDALSDQIAEKERELAAIRGIAVCGVCGAANPMDHVYCTQCGQPLNR